MNKEKSMYITSLTALFLTLVDTNDRCYDNPGDEDNLNAHWDAYADLRDEDYARQQHQHVPSIFG